MAHGTTRNDRPCWKCGQQVRHTRRWGWRIGFMVMPQWHLVLKAGHWVVCKGSERAG